MLTARTTTSRPAPPGPARSSPPLLVEAQPAGAHDVPPEQCVGVRVREPDAHEGDGPDDVEERVAPGPGPSALGPGPSATARAAGRRLSP